MNEAEIFQIITSIGASAVLFWRLTIADRRIVELEAEIKRLNSVLIDKFPSMAQYLKTDK